MISTEFSLNLSYDYTSFFRLFVAPGMLHCMGGPGPNSFGNFLTNPEAEFDTKRSIISALEAWVEKGQPPEKVIATKYKDDDPAEGILATRPICPYPQISVYNGTGSLDEAQNYTCLQG